MQSLLNDLPIKARSDWKRRNDFSLNFQRTPNLFFFFLLHLEIQGLLHLSFKANFWLSSDESRAINHDLVILGSSIPWISLDFLIENFKNRRVSSPSFYVKLSLGGGFSNWMVRSTIFHLASGIFPCPSFNVWRGLERCSGKWLGLLTHSRREVDNSVPWLHKGGSSSLHIGSPP